MVAGLHAALTIARDTERNAARDLRLHIETHGCWALIPRRKLTLSGMSCDALPAARPPFRWLLHGSRSAVHNAVRPDSSQAEQPLGGRWTPYCGAAEDRRSRLQGECT